VIASGTIKNNAELPQKFEQLERMQSDLTTLRDDVLLVNPRSNLEQESTAETEKDEDDESSPLPLLPPVHICDSRGKIPAHSMCKS
jgi:hypothetical protein